MAVKELPSPVEDLEGIVTGGNSVPPTIDERLKNAKARIRQIIDEEFAGVERRITAKERELNHYFDQLEQRWKERYRERWGTDVPELTETDIETYSRRNGGAANTHYAVVRGSPAKLTVLNPRDIKPDELYLMVSAQPHYARTDIVPNALSTIANELSQKPPVRSEEKMLLSGLPSKLLRELQDFEQTAFEEDRARNSLISVSAVARHLYESHKGWEIYVRQASPKPTESKK